MSQTLEQSHNDTHSQGAATEGKRGRGGRIGKPADTLGSERDDASTATPTGLGGTDSGAESRHGEAPDTPANSILSEHPQAKFVLFAIRPEERVSDGPVMRGFIELPSVEEAEPTKINVAGWAKVGRESGSEYLSLKVGNTRAPVEGHSGSGEWEVGPFYGRLFKETSRTRQGTRIRYFGFIEHSERVGEDKNLRGVYQTHWQVAVRAKRATSSDGRTNYLSGTVTPGQAREAGSDDLPF